MARTNARVLRGRPEGDGRPPNRPGGPATLVPAPAASGPRLALGVAEAADAVRLEKAQGPAAERGGAPAGVGQMAQTERRPAAGEPAEASRRPAAAEVSGDFREWWRLVSAQRQFEQAGCNPTPAITEPVPGGTGREWRPGTSS